MAVLRSSRSLNCPKFTPARDRYESRSMQRRSTQPTSGSGTARAPNSRRLILHLTFREWRRRGSSRIRKHFPQGVDGLADGAVLNALVIPAVRDGGAFTSVRGFRGIPQRDIHFTTTMVRSYAQDFEKLDWLRQQVEAGEITLRVAEVYPPERGAEAHRRLEAGGTRGRLVIQF